MVLFLVEGKATLGLDVGQARPAAYVVVLHRLDTVGSLGLRPSYYLTLE